jgi:cation diffusion facilitator CzcD-associated flavoprotein CzcO
MPIAVIGAGACGLVAAKKLLDQGLTPVVYEENAALGGNWRFGAPGSAVYRSTHLISSKRMTEFRDFPLPDDWPPYIHHEQALAYLESYARQFGILPHIRFNTRVARAAHRSQSGWRIETADGGSEEYGALVVASGHHRDPFLPSFPGDFAGPILHSHAYREPEPFRGQRVLVVGAGNSGCDIAVELAGVAARVFHSTRRGYWYIPKFVFGQPADAYGHRLRRLGMPAWLFQLVSRLSAELVLGRPERFGLPRPDHALFETHPVVNSQLYYAVGHGRVTPRPDVARLDGRKVHFADGSAEEVDTILCATGYRLSFPFLADDDLNLKEGLPVLYKNIFHPHLPDLFFVGLIQPNSGLWFLAELQAELVARALAGPAKQLAAAIEDRQATGYFDYLKSPRHHLEVDYYRYQRDLERLLRLAPGRPRRQAAERDRRASAKG